MRERYLRFAIQKNEPGAKLAGISERILQIGCDIPIPIPSGRRRLSKIEEPLRFMLGTEKNGGMAVDVVEERYDSAITGWETVLDLTDNQRNEVVVVSHMENLVAPCEYRPAVSAQAFGVETLAELKELMQSGVTIPRRLEDLPRGTAVATKHVNMLNRYFREHNLKLESVYCRTPELATELLGINYIADNYEHGTTMHEHNFQEMEEVMLRPHGVLLKVSRLPKGVGPIFNEEFLPRFYRALEHPERWINPGAQTPNNETNQAVENKPEHRFWPLGGLFRSSARVAVVSTLLFTLLNTSAILNPWHSKTSEEKDSKS